METERTPSPAAPPPDESAVVVRGPRESREQAGPVYARYAGLVSRTMAMVVDLLIVGGVLIIGGMAVDFMARTSGLNQLLGILSSAMPWLAPAGVFLRSTLFELMITLGCLFLYFTFFYSFGGATIGKALMGLRVVTADGRRLRPRRAALRALAYAPSALALYLGFLAVLTDDRRRGWHDRIARTVVVYKWQARPDSPPPARAQQPS